MKKIVLYFTIMVGFSTLVGCNFSHSESGMQINIADDQGDLILAKESLRFITESKEDSLRSLFNSKVLENSTSEQFDYLLENGKTIIENSNYPTDSEITVSRINTKSIIGDNESFKEFSFPFVNKANQDSIVYLNVAISNNKIDKLFIRQQTKIVKIL